MRSALLKTLNEYLDQTKLPDKPSVNFLAKYFLDTVPGTIINQVGLNSNRYKVKVQSSVGQGNWTETPYLVFLTARFLRL